VRLLGTCALMIAAGIGAEALRGQAVGSPRERLEHAADASDLTKMEAKPWHLVLAVTLFDANGKSPVEGTIEYWRSGEESRRVITVGASSETEVHHEGQTFLGHSGEALPDTALDVFAKFMHPGPAESDISGTEPELRKQSFGKVTLDCVMLSQPIKRVAFAPLGLFPTYCLTHDGDHLVVSYDFGSETVTVNRQGRFQEHDVPVEFSLAEGLVTVAKAKVTTLAGFVPANDFFLPGALPSLASVRAARISSGVMAGNILSKVQPEYPSSARAGHVSGSVVLRAMIGRDGHVHQLRVMSAPDPDLAIAALAAVRKWTYKPYLLNGEATEVDTTVVVNFNLSPF
jgi:TonB family protein